MEEEAHVFKNSDGYLPSNYRSISVLNSIDKLFKRAVFKHLYTDIHSNNFLSPLQSGFFP